MNAAEIVALRAKLGISQAQFASLMGVHPMTVSRWERGLVSPTPYQIAFMTEYRKGASKKSVQEAFSSVLIGAGIVAAVLILLEAARKGE